MNSKFSFDINNNNKSFEIENNNTKNNVNIKDNKNKNYKKIGNYYIKQTKLSTTKDVIEDIKNKRGLLIESNSKFYILIIIILFL